MTDKQINAAIAEACGWTELQNTMDGCYGLKSPMRGYIRIPDYCTDLNAMHEVEKSMDEEQWQDYVEYVGGTWKEAMHATARQRAEAFLRTLGKWHDQSGERTKMEGQK